MLRLQRFVQITLVIIVLAAALAPVAAADNRNEITVGEFVVMLAETSSLPATTPEIAADSLRSAGWEFPTVDMKGVLTERIVVDIANSSGIDVNTSNPETPFTSDRVETFMLAFDKQLGSDDGDNETRGDDNNGADPLTKGKGLKKGLLKKSPSEPV